MKNTYQQELMLCREGKCVDIAHNDCDYAFDDYENQIECEEMKRNI